MNQIQYVKDILGAISSVRSRANEALSNGDIQSYGTLMLDLMALELCLVNQAGALVAEAA